ncbi:MULTISPECIES: MarR family winged helix-turn-helix transcriptional regulator [unclassified Microbacterium]|uniref:MarR family winged helix-turn-helix transcriptional regulator n=1 Tax=unclassified Microbacterium TaxID=2609290 RepID=UPI000EAAA3AB|nr:MULTISPECIES: MarR family transcriptional regulator [unclassified Microbacterium]MBT2483788.1 MarR family transcriptional regulator [Microbacterium sp. ISL-108]RKN66774.1 MarR family transcriptional regulator [Microbacterium sp. CGR2]
MYSLLLDRLLQIGDLFQRDMARAFEGTGLTTARVHLLWMLQHAGPSTQQTLARLCEVTPRNITGLVDALEQSGHVRRNPHPTDRRAVLVELTDSAAEIMTRMQREHAELNDTLRASVDPDDRAAVERGITAIATHLEDLVTAAADEKTADAAAKKSAP